MMEAGSGQPGARGGLSTRNLKVDLEDLTIRIESPSSNVTQELVRMSADGHGTDDLIAPNSEFLVARLGDRPVGCIALVDHLRYGEARRLFVAEDLRGNGIAVALVEALEAAARDIGLRSIRIARSTARASLRPWTARGYTPVAEAWMEKAL